MKKMSKIIVFENGPFLALWEPSPLDSLNRLPQNLHNLEAVQLDNKRAKFP